MKKILLVGAVALLAACGSSSGVSVGSKTSTPSAGSSAQSSGTGSSDTISVKNFGDMPPQCIKLLSTFLKQIEPIVSKVDWTKATLADFEALGTQFTDESKSFDTQSTAAGCDKYNVTGSDADQLKQVMALAAKEAPGTLKFLTYMSTLSSSTTGGGATGASIPADCAGLTAAVEAYMAKGKTIKDLTMADITSLGQVVSAIGTSCTPDEASAFFDRADVKAFLSA
ncbi:MAG: hypothetical protein ACXV98_08070 [Ilumatobacteraceae bacterium]